MTDFMERAILLARKGKLTCRPNPMVGAVIVKDNTIIGEGYHRVCGGPHAERNAIADMKQRGFDAHGATLYVTLEPCCHQGRTAPCTEAIIEEGFEKVIIGSRDPNPLVSGKGVQILKDAGIEVIQDHMKEQCDELNPVFFHYITTRTPYVRYKYAMTLDGKIATKTGASKWITGEKSRMFVHKMRSENYAIMVGVNTVIEDDPLLTSRTRGGRNPIRIICDSHLNTPISSRIVRTCSFIKTIFATTEEEMNSERAAYLREEGAIVIAAGKRGHVNLKILMQKLGEMEIDSILLEGGPTLGGSAIREGIVNEIYAFVAPKVFGGSTAKTPAEGEGVKLPDQAHMFEIKSVRTFGDDILIFSKKKEG